MHYSLYTYKPARYAVNMKNLLALALLFALPAQAAVQGAPFTPEEDARFNCLESGYCATGGSYVAPGYSSGATPFSALFNNAGGTFGQIGQSNWKADVVINGKVASTVGYTTGIVLPANTIIRQAWIFNKTAVGPSGTTTALQCDAAGDILAATDETGVAAGAIIGTLEGGTAASMHVSSLGCTVKFLVSVHTASAGEWSLFIESVPAQ